MLDDLKQKLSERFPTELACKQFFENVRWPGGVISPFNQYSPVYYCKNQDYRCKISGKYFNVKTNTMMSRSRLTYFEWIYCFERVVLSDLTPNALSVELGLTRKSAQNLLRKIKTIESHIPSANNVDENLTLSDWLAHLK